MVKTHDIRSKTPRSNSTRPLSAIEKIARHHSGGNSGDFFTFWKYWNGTKGWGTGGYHEIILRDGSVQICYDPNEITNGVGGHNSYVYHICVVGNGSFTEAQEKAWQERCLFNLKRLNLDVDDVLGHNEFSGTSTACPGIDMNLVRKRLKTPAPVQKEEEVDMLKRAIVIGSFNDYPVAEVLANRLHAPIYPRSSIKGEVAEELFLVGAEKTGLVARKITSLSGVDRFATAEKVKEYLSK